MLKATSVGVRGAPSSGGFTYSEEFLPDSQEKILSYGQLFVLVGSNLHRVGAIPIEVGKEILENVQKEYYSSTGKPFNSLKITLEKVATKFSLTWGEIEIIATSFVGGVVYTAIWGSSEALILRGGMLASVLKGRGNLVSASGYPQQGDFLVLATKDFMDKVPQYSLKESIKSTEFLNISSNLTSFQSADSPIFGALVISFTNEIFSSQVLGSGLDSQKRPSVLGNVMGRVKNLFKKGDTERRIYLKSGDNLDYEAESKKTTLTVGVILMVLLLVSIIFGVRQKNLKNIKSRYETRLTQARHDFDEAQKLFAINPERSRELFLSSREIANNLEKEGIKDDSLNGLLKTIKENEGQILGEIKVNLENFVDLSLVSSGFRGRDIASSGEEIFVLDPNLKRVVQVTLQSKKSQVVGGPEEVGDSTQIVAYEDRSFVVKENEIAELEDGKRIEKGWDGDVLVYSYAANLYVLEKSTSSIWRYSGSSSGFGSKQSWLGSGLTLDFTQAKSFAIDGSMWVLEGNGSIDKFTFGTVDTFNPTGLPGTLSNAVNLYTNEDNENLYVLDPSNSRIVVFDKSGEFKVQYLSDDLKNATDLVVNENENKIIILVNGNLKSININN